RVLGFQVVEYCVVMPPCLRKEFEPIFALQFFTARKPDTSHPALSQNLNQRVAAENFLTASELPLSGLHCGVGRMIAHFVHTSNCKDGDKVKTLPAVARLSRQVEDVALRKATGFKERCFERETGTNLRRGGPPNSS